MSKGISLYDLAESYQNVLDLDLDDEQASQILGQIEEAVEQKIENIGLARRSVDAEAEILKVEIKRLQDRKASLEKKSDWLKDYAYQAMKRFEIDKVKGTRLTVWIQNNPESVEIINEDKIPKKYKVKQPDKVDKKLLLDELKGMDKSALKKIKYATIKQGEGIRFK